VERDAFVIASSAEDVLEGASGANLQSLVDSYQRRTGARAVIVDTRGISVADSAPQSPNERDFATRPEIKRALAGTVAFGVRRSSTLNTDLLYVAVPAASGGVIHGAVRITFSMGEVSARIMRTWIALGLVALVALIVSGVVGWMLASSAARPLRGLESATRRLADGDLDARAPPSAGPREVRAVARAFNDMGDRLKELVNAQSEFVADASHQLRTPLTALQLRMENIEEEAEGGLRQEAEAAGEELWRLRRIVDGLLALARAEGARPTTRSEDASAIIAARARAWAPLAHEKGVTVEVTVSPELHVEEVPGGLEQILDNLMANALEAAPPRSSIQIDATHEGPWTVIHVSDEGPGLTAEERSHAFDRFWRGSASDASGSGLGLAIVRQLARVSGGDAELRISKAGGVEAVVRLPTRSAVTADGERRSGPVRRGVRSGR
jgi:signal transduction histidine kinase